MFRKVLFTIIGLCVFAGNAYAQSSSIWGATDRAPASGTDRIPVDESSSSGAGFLEVDDIATYTKANTAVNDLSDVDTTGVANGDFLFRSGGSFSVFSKAELNLAIGTDIQAHSSVLDNTTASYTTTEETKLSNIEALADVTDTANVTSAGALMDSEVDADIKTLALPASTTITTYTAGLLDDANESAIHASLNLEAGTDFYSISAANAAFEAADAELTTLAGLTETNGNVIYASGSAWTSQDFTDLDEDRECVRLSDVGSDATTGTGVANLYFADALTVTGVYAWADTAPTGSVATIDINDAGTTILSTKLTIDAGEKTSGTAATAAVISDTAIAANAEITFDIDGVGSSTAGQGYVACIEFTK